MRVLIQTILWTVGLVAAVSTMGWFLTFNIGRDLPPAVEVEGLLAPVSVEWLDGYDARIRAENADDFYASLGVVHAVGRPWLLPLIRQAAVGRLSEWFGPATLDLDRHIQMLGLTGNAMKAVSDMPADARARLAAYADGVNAGLGSGRVQYGAASVELNLSHEPWEAYHSVAVELLMTWISADIANADESPAIGAARDSLARFLGLTGLNHGAVWSDSAGTFGRFVVGDAAISPFVTVAFDAANGVKIQGVTVVGTPIMPCGAASSHSWCYLLSGAADVVRDTLDGPPTYFRIELPNGAVQSWSRRHSGDRVALSDELALSWPGLEANSDWPAWDRLRRGAENEAFDVTSGTGLFYSGDRWSASGPVGFQVPYEGGMLVSAAEEAGALAVSLSVRIGENTLLDTGSAWASEDRLETPSTTYPGTREALDYLRNWDRRFNGASIAATIFDARRTSSSLDSAVATLTSARGSDLRTWRWESDSDARLFMPGFRQTPLPRHDPVALRRSGHPTAPSWGTSRAFNAMPAPSAWEVHLDAPGGIQFRAAEVPYDRFLGRFLATPITPMIRSLTDESTRFTSQLRPSS